MTADEELYQQRLKRLKALIPPREAQALLSQDECELDNTFLGFLEVYEPLSQLIPKNKVVIDFGCYMAAHAYLFKDHDLYIGVDTDKLKRFTPSNAVHYTCSIQDFIRDHLPRYLRAKNIYDFFAICSYVPDREAVKLVQETFPNVCCYYPS